MKAEKIATLNAVFPIARVVLYKSGIELIRKSKRQGKPNPGRDNRQIRKLSKKSLSKLAFTAMSSSVEFMSMMTLTYPRTYASDGQMIKKDLNKFLIYARRKFGNFSYLWFMEFQKRGAPHFHIMTTLPAPTEKQLHQFACAWSPIAARNNSEAIMSYRVHSHKKSWEGIRLENGAKRYVLKYAYKTEQKQVPVRYQNVGRFWACSRDVVPKPMQEIVASEATARAILEALGHQAKDWAWLPKYITTKEIDIEGIS